MIKIQFSGSTPNIYQIDRSYNQPGITGAVQWNGMQKRLEVSNGTGWIPLDNTVEMSSSGPDIWAMHSWIQEKKREEEETKKLRSKYPALDEAYNHLELIKSLVAAGPETNDIQQN
jgi:hypothetical protein